MLLATGGGPMLPLTLLLLLTLTGSALLTLLEVALFSLGESRLRTMVGEGFRGSGPLLSLREHPEELLVLLRAGKTLTDAGAAVAGGLLGWTAAGAGGAVAGVIAVALALLILTQLLATRAGLAHNVRIALGAARPTAAILRALSPVLGLLRPLVRGLPERPIPVMSGEEEQEVRQLAQLGHTEGVIEEEERQLIERAFRLDESRAHDIMTPRVDIFAWPDSRTLKGIARQLQNVPYSRIPVYGETIDDITGVLYIRDAYQALLMGQRDAPLGELAREPLIVPGSIPLTQLLKDFQGRRIHLAVVVDEYGGTDGLVTLEDVLEELVGEIVDETDVAEELIVRISRHEIVAAGDADLREINHFFNTSFPLLEHRSLNGYLLEELGRVPDPGERLSREGIEIEILEASETQVLRARLERSPSAVAELAGREAESPIDAEPPIARGPGGPEEDQGDGAGAPSPGERRGGRRPPGVMEGRRES